MLTGVSEKSLELLRKGVDMKINRKLYNKYSAFLNELDKNNFSKSTGITKKVWIYFVNGIERASALEKKCFDSVCSQLQGYDIILLNDKNVNDFVYIPDYIWKKYDTGIMINEHFSEFIRIALLAEHGGVWIDTSVYCSSLCKIPRYMLESDFFVMQNLKPASDGAALNSYKWFMSSRASSRIIVALYQMLLKYWENDKCLPCNRLLEHFLNIAASYYPEEWKRIYQYPNALSNLLSLSMSAKYDKDKVKTILSSIPLHKFNNSNNDGLSIVNDMNYSI